MQRTCIALVIVALHPAILLAADIHLEFDPPNPTFGRIERNAGTALELTVKATNKSKTVVLDRVEVGCGCLQATITGPREIPAGGNTTVGITLRMDEIRKGSFAYPLSLIADNALLATTKVMYEYAPGIEVEPKIVHLGARADSEEAAVSCAIVESVPHLLSQIRAIPSQPWLRVEIDQQAKSLRVTVPPTRPFGFVNERITLQSINGQVEQIVPVTGEFRAPVVLQPTILVLDEVSRSSTVRRTVNLVASGHYQLKDVCTSSPDIAVEAGKGAGEYVIMFKHPNSASANIVEATVEFVFSEPREFSLVLPVVAACE